MEDVELVVKLPEEEYNIIKKSNAPMTWAEHLIAKGIPLSKNDLEVDCISRAYLLDDSKYHTVFNDDTGNFEDVVYREDIEKAPSVTPIRPKGHWIKTPKAVMGEGYMWYCDKCEYQVYQDSSRDYPSERYCPNCGSDNREVAE